MLITGGARSGKSTFAEALAAGSKKTVFYIATMEEISTDAEAVERIARHRKRRPEDWLTMESALQVDRAVQAIDKKPAVCLIDCLSLYVSNLVLEENDGKCEYERLENKVVLAANTLLDAIALQKDVEFIVVTNEVGWGIVPENGLARAYRDLLGIVNQIFARSATRVWLSCSGLQLPLK